MIKCEDVLRMLYEYIDKQLDKVSSFQIEEHIKLCKYCRKHHDFEIALQKMVERSCFKKKAPDVLKTKIKAMLNDAPPE
ncbi:MAG: zf-HC2 domain-containing protein [candidate division Zixibacteria bacterium]|nr:zf-HC2 domain-containing protein [candidate division Zixibacteria bacterium]